MKTLLIPAILLAVQINAVHANTGAVNSLMENYKTQGAVIADSLKGEQMWNKQFAGKAPYAERSCNSCHTNKLTNTGEHVRTGKMIAAMAPSVNNKSLTEVKKIKKWLKRNCKWTLGRECTIQEKTDLLSFISKQ